ncbi:MAG: hypothetical protein COW00_01340 [Bdellovibrio sp. CG12_big_fil_rev_8_21_14_0_65_39_13]|nr:MAG: hypothetical protein COW78_17470 [Bdellovibrio sp. CG22_combo_CG10-13_8_21_14_all_39_27]PIQ62610.1 MAG: hypothetical protein COW00_01340 [Bdellovibrio sp. CG12_big_fil_rev_8_21_14_0_65_39_13]PIR36965.1 MAG: hypothetical protein COV37_00295 [Bdellovibrio sp. CG11_big_fil_rev_8_21_14_0_20_39_38]
MSIRQTFFYIVVLLFVGCSGITMLNQKKDDLYSEKFIQQIEQVKNLFRQGQADRALSTLKQIDDSVLLPTEKASRRNLMGVIWFSKDSYEQAIYNFDQALTTSSLDSALTSQVHLNLASSYFKLGNYEKAYSASLLVDAENLPEADKRKHFRILYRIASELGRDREVVLSLIHYLSDKKSINDLKTDPLFEKLSLSFSNLDSNSRLKVLQEFENKKFFVVGFLGFSEAERLYYSSSRDEANSIIRWILQKFDDSSELKDLSEGLQQRALNLSRMNPEVIGVILPLTGDKKSYGQRALVGIDSMLREAIKENPRFANYKLVIKDSEGSGAIGALRIKELIEKESASLVIGGLFSNEAEREYLEAKRNGILFVSLSQIYIPKEMKDHLVVEIPGSIESQINMLFKQDSIKNLGKRASVLYPKGPRGEAIVNEFWRKAHSLGVEVIDVLPFDENQTDFREVVRNVLGLKYPRVRQEEYDILNDIFNIEEARGTRRLQVLPPRVDFDWIFVPAFPKEALQIIPSFAYYDAFNVKFIGGPSWRSKAISDESTKLGELFLLGDDIESVDESFSNAFLADYKRRPRLIEIVAHDALSIAIGLLKDSTVESRIDLDRKVRSTEFLSGKSGKWKLEEGVWIKEMALIKLRNGKYEKLVL